MNLGLIEFLQVYKCQSKDGVMFKMPEDAPFVEFGKEILAKEVRRDTKNGGEEKDIEIKINHAYP
jgi:hypothetical protein